jgi:hypothetical protein
MMSKRLMWTAVLVGAALAPAAFAIGAYFTAGLGAYSEVKIEYPLEARRGGMGPSWALGGGVAVPVWQQAGAALLTLELTTDCNISMIDKDFEEFYLYGYGAKFTVIPIREAAVFGVGVGPAAAVKPFCGFGVGLAIVDWKLYWALPDLKLDGGTDVKAVVSIPFGCEFRVTPDFSLGPRAEYLIITGGGDGFNLREFRPFEMTVPDVFLFGAAARFDF